MEAQTSKIYDPFAQCQRWIIYDIIVNLKKKA